MIFVAHQLLEKAREHQDSFFTLFVDLRKAYDSVPREALWQVLVWCSSKDVEGSEVIPCTYADNGQSGSFRVRQV